MFRPGAFSIPPVPLALTLGGLVPFIAAAAMIAGGDDVIRQQQAVFMLAGYAAVILSFLGGVRWGVEMLDLAGQGGPRLSVLGPSVLGALAGWIALGLILLHPTLPPGQVLIGLAVALGLHWAWDLSARAALPAWYDGLRTIASAGAVGALLLAGLTL